MGKFAVKNLDARGIAKAVSTTDGKMNIRLFDSNRKDYLIESIKLKDGTGFELAFGHSELRFNSTQGQVVLGLDGVTFPGKTWVKYSSQSIDRIAKLIKSDSSFQSAALGLRRSFHEGIFALASMKSMNVDKNLFNHVANSSKKMTAFGKRPVGLDCKPVKVTERITKPVYDWVESVKTALDQLAACEEKCRKTYGGANGPKPLEYAACLIDCGAQTFQDIVVRTYELVGTIVEEVVTDVIYCTPVLNTLPTPVKGRVPLPANLYIQPASKAIDLDKVIGDLGGITDVLNCFIKGQWDSVPLGDLKIDVPGVKEIPIAAKVCMDRKCADLLRDTFLGKDLLNKAKKLLEVLSSGGSLAFLLKLGISQSILAAIAKELGAGVTATSVAGAILGMFLVLLIHSIIIGGQIALLDANSAAPKGVCLNYPVYPLGAIGVINPLAAMVLAPNIPVIVTAR